MQAFVEAPYEYRWTPLLGCLSAQLRCIGADSPSHVIGAASGLLYQPPASTDIPPHLTAALVACGVKPSIIDDPHAHRLQRFRARRLVRNELRRGRPVTAFGVGVTAFGPTYGLIVGVDDDRSAWRREGPMTDQISPWLSEDEFNASRRLTLVAASRQGDIDKQSIRRVAAEALLQHAGSAALDLRFRIDMLNSDQELDPQRHANEAQTLAANWGVAASFWREHPHPDYTALSRDLAVTLSRFATLFPYPMGGHPNHPGVRNSAVHILHEAADMLGAAH